MKNFLAIYRGEPSKGNAVWNSLSPQEREKRQLEGMQAWGAWMQKHEANIVYAGGPLGKTLQTDKNGVSAKVNHDCGFVVVKANSHEEAAQMFINHPFFAIFPGENIEVMECLPIPGQR